VSAPRTGISGVTLPSAREVSARLFQDRDIPHEHASMVAVAFGHFVFHDISHTPQTAGFQGARLKCCNVPNNLKHPECFEIPVSSNDPFYGGFGQNCLDYVRSSTAPRETCGLGPREQNNQVTSFVDGSTIYGSSEAEARFLRSFEDGLLLTQRNDNGEEIPVGDASSLDCRGSKSAPCFSSGDPRMNQNIGLAWMTTMWIREHNRVARELKGLNPSWDDETLYQEARRIVGAEIQHIAYSELLPTLVGPEVVERFGLRMDSNGFFTGYDHKRLPGVTNVMGSTGLWALLSALPGNNELFDAQRFRKLGSIPSTETAFHPQDLYNSNRFRQYVAGALMQRAQRMDAFFSHHVTRDMFAPASGQPGLDLAAIAIQQSRDHGLAGYTKWRQFCGLRNIDNFEGLLQVMDKDIALQLSELYATVADVDLFVAALAETPVEGGLVGPTLACIYAHQFRHLRISDRFWYENPGQPSSFTKNQLQEIRHTSLARVICDNVFRGGVIQPRVMQLPDPWLNNLQSCDDRLLTSVNLEQWAQESPLKNLPSGLMIDALNDASNALRGNLLGDGDFAPHRGKGFMRANGISRNVHNQSEVLELATRKLMNELGRDKRRTLDDNFIPALRHVDLSKFHREFEEPAACEPTRLQPCNPRTPFRTMSGRCNNLRSPNFGKVSHSFRRILPSRYDDNISAARQTSVTGAPLPPSRVVSAAVHSDLSVPHQKYTQMLMQMGQFMDHDVAHTPLSEGPNESTLKCRKCDSPLKENHQECFPITIPHGDPFFPSVSAKTGRPLCLPFTRSMSGQRTLGSREQINQVTGFLDLSTVYGSDNCAREELRLLRNGQLNMSAHPADPSLKPLLPEIQGAADCLSSNDRCFIAGDTRVSEQPALTSMHTMFAREHNRIALELSRLNPHWDDERSFQEARRILTAMYQRVIYAEWLPRVLGWEAVSQWGLNLLDSGYYAGYDPTCDVGVFNEFGTAAFRFGHTLLPPAFKLLGPAYNEIGRIKLTDAFFNSQILYKRDQLDQLVRGLMATPMENFDNHVTNMVTEHLFESKTIPFSGLDLVAINLQRGRDHGLRGYNDYREFCGKPRLRSFQDLQGEVSPNAIRGLSNVYRHVDDIDLFSGGLSEIPLPGAVVGPTFSCIIGFQFQRLRRCDRYWHENDEHSVRFTEGQLAELRKASLAKLLCENMDTTKFVTRSVLDLYDPFLNPRVSCQSIQGPNIAFWRENPNKRA
ncbi:hypothetical protein BIW11_13171, partial [Tropilaelaps mercedesae]